MGNGIRSAPPRAVFFDWDGTLVDSLSIIVAGHNHVRDHYGLTSMSRHDVLRAMRAGAAMDVMRGIYGDKAEEALALYRSHVIPLRKERITRLPGADALVEELAARKIPQGIVSNVARDILIRELEGFGWTKTFPVLVAADEAPRNKPHPDPLLLALERAGLAGVDPAEVWYVGDMETDIACAKAAGCVAVYIEEQGAPPLPETTRPDLWVRGCEELRAKIADFFS